MLVGAFSFLLSFLIFGNEVSPFCYAFNNVRYPLIDGNNVTYEVSL